MDFMNRGNRPVQPNSPAPEGVGSAPKAPNTSKSPKLKDSSKLLKAGYVAFLAAIAILILAVVLSLVFSKGSGNTEESKVNKDKYQAVFLNGGQVYFGKISDINSKSVGLNSIYYLRVNQQVQPNQANNPSANDISLVKLGCELHGPDDSMVINREQVIFWENLKTDGQVTKAINEYKKANPNGQKCDQQQQQSTNSGASGTNGSATSNSSSTSSTNSNSSANSSTNNTNAPANR